MRLLGIALSLILIGCSGAPNEIKVADEKLLIEFNQAVKEATLYVGQPARWGGVIANLTNLTPNTSELQISQFALDSKGRPDDTQQDSQRFVVNVDRFLDPEVFTQGKSMTFVGVIEGMTSITVGQQELKVPVLKASNYYLWTEDKRIKTYYVGDPYYNYYYDSYYYWDDIDDADLIEHYDDFDYDYGDF
ncbi:Slp family lipoprotein [Vibrio sp. La 4.2.2]|uniref:Slp family lipoprotein n=1 Tax=Vibrio sp. La 4.2.2 TaxID=2998830 RepID=UPI0022CE1AE2|nr:Slp family lipoprotein [Vibrio sp. La 4.2.2]MDA0109614.1 Slp family lipoprotein [Vibrio sp. La 4.2.2]